MIRPHPKAETRQGTQKVQKGRSIILTDIAIKKQEIENISPKILFQLNLMKQSLKIFWQKIDL